MKYKLIQSVSLAAPLLLLSAFIFTDINEASFNMEPEKKAASVSEHTVKLFPEETQTISPYLMGFNLVYAHETDAIWSGGKLTEYLNEINTSVFRYPGGTVTTFYHWNELTGEGWKDSWDPVNPVTPKPGSAFMDVDEFMQVIRNTNAIPLVGINMSSGMRWNRTQDGIDEALSLMYYLKDNDFHVEYYYLDNEPYQDDANGGSKTATEYANLVNLYADEMRKIDPDIKIIINWRQVFSNRRSEYQNLFNIAGHNIDAVDVHWYWNFSNASMEEWLKRTPMVLWTGDSYVNEIAYFRQMVMDFGYPDTELMTLEWNTGPITSDKFTPHQIALAHSEMLMIFMQGGLDMATFWPMHWPNNNITLRSFYDRYNSTPQPTYETFKFLGKLQGSDLIKTEITQPMSHTMIVAAMDEIDDVLRISYLNKNATNVKANIESGMFGNMILKEASSYSLTGGGSGSEMKSLQLLNHSASGISFEALPVSLSMLTFERSTSSHLKNSSGKGSVVIYPNPASESVYLEIPWNETGVTVTILNSTGSEILQQKIPAGIVKSRININRLDDGVYMVMVLSKSKRTVNKLIINNN